jgi:FG-GAP repeat protein
VLFRKLVAMAAAVGAATAPAGICGTCGTFMPRVSAQAAECSPHGPDFNGDGCGDLVVGDPEATAGGQSGAGRITVLYGGPEGVGSGGHALLSQGPPGVGESPEIDDGFGAILESTHLNDDNHADLVIGVPSESVRGIADAGVIHVIFGSADGLGEGPEGLVLAQGQGGLPGAPQEDDRFGAALAVNPTVIGYGEPRPSVAFGAPGADVGGRDDAGTAGIITFDRTAGTPAEAAAITQNSPGIRGGAEAGDRFGTAVALFQGPGGFSCEVNGVKGLTLVVGAPGENLGSSRDAGMVHVVRDLATDSALTQNTPGVDSDAEGGDQFGASLALSSYCEHDGPSHVKLAVGVPAEDLGTARQAGMFHLFEAEDLPFALRQRWSAAQDAADVAGAAETGDRFGAVLKFGSTWLGSLGDPLVVGVPAEDIGPNPDAGGVQVFGDATRTPGTGDVFLTQQELGQRPEAGDRFGTAVSAPYDRLIVGAPDDKSYQEGAVHGIAWTAVIGTPAPDLLLVPGGTGVPGGGSRFGAGLG